MFASFLIKALETLETIAKIWTFWSPSKWFDKQSVGIDTYVTEVPPVFFILIIEVISISDIMVIEEMLKGLPGYIWKYCSKRYVMNKSLELHGTL